MHSVCTFITCQAAFAAYVPLQPNAYGTWPGSLPWSYLCCIRAAQQPAPVSGQDANICIHALPGGCLFLPLKGSRYFCRSKYGGSKFVLLQVTMQQETSVSVSISCTCPISFPQTAPMNLEVGCFLSASLEPFALVSWELSPFLRINDTIIQWHSLSGP